MTARDYPVTFGYGAVDNEYYFASKPHRGNDRPTPNGTSIYIGDTLIGLTGATGRVSGAHLHTQAGSDEWCQNTWNPGSLEFQPGTVAHVGTADQWGNYIIINTGGGYICYAHLSKIYVQEGQVIKGAVSAGGNTVDTLKSMFWRLLGREIDQDAINHYTDQVNKKGWEFVYNDIKNSAEGQADWDRRNPARVAQLEANSAMLADVTRQLNELKAMPAKEVIKEVEKIVEVTKEVKVEVPVYVHDQETKDNVNAILKLVKSIWGSLTSLHKKIK